jgi:hypothetical protein
MTDENGGAGAHPGPAVPSVREALGKVNVKVAFRAKGHKSSEGDGRTAADIRRELAEQAARKE